MNMVSIPYRYYKSISEQAGVYIQDGFQFLIGIINPAGIVAVVGPVLRFNSL